MSAPTDLTNYPRPNVAVDLAVLTAIPAYDGPGTLAVLVMDLGPGQARVLPGRFLRERQTVAEAVADVVRLKLELEVRVPEPRLLKVFDDPARDERAWALSLAHALVLPHHVAADADGEMVPVLADGSLATGEWLAYDHDLIVRERRGTSGPVTRRCPTPTTCSRNSSRSRSCVRSMRQSYARTC